MFAYVYHYSGVHTNRSLKWDTTGRQRHRLQFKTRESCRVEVSGSLVQLTSQCTLKLKLRFVSVHSAPHFLLEDSF